MMLYRFEVDYTVPGKMGSKNYVTAVAATDAAHARVEAGKIFEGLSSSSCRITCDEIVCSHLVSSFPFQLILSKAGFFACCKFLHALLVGSLIRVRREEVIEYVTGREFTANRDTRTAGDKQTIARLDRFVDELLLLFGKTEQAYPFGTVERRLLEQKQEVGIQDKILGGLVL